MEVSCWMLLLKCNFDENEDNHHWHNNKPVDAVRVVILTVMMMVMMIVVMMMTMTMVMMMIITVDTALSPLISWCVTAVTMSFVVSLEYHHSS